MITERGAVAPLGLVAVLSLEPWDDVWRRNQHLASRLVQQGACDHLIFVEPPVRGLTTRRRQVSARLSVVTPPLPVPRRIGGLRGTAAVLRRNVLRDVDVLWINEPVLGAMLVDAAPRAAYDVTDDWRASDLQDRIRRRLVRAEDELATRARTIVCSQALRQRWADRYGVDAPVIHNGVDTAALDRADPVGLSGPGPHIGYVGTLHAERLDVPLVRRLADDDAVGTLHLVGPDALAPSARDLLDGHPKIRFEGPVSAAAVPAWLLALDVLICPHLVTDFTMSLDAIKSYEYLASGRPITATPTSGFQDMVMEPTVLLRTRDAFPAGVREALSVPAVPPGREELGWDHRCEDFARVLAALPHHRAEQRR